MVKPIPSFKQLHSAQPGTGGVLAIGMFFVSVFFAVLSVDTAFYFMNQNQAQTTADSAALAAANGLFLSSSSTVSDRRDDGMLAGADIADENMSTVSLTDSDFGFGYVDPSTKQYDGSSFSITSADTDLNFSGGVNAVSATVWMDNESATQIPTIFGKIIGKDSMESVANAVAMMDMGVDTISDGLRPFYICEGVFDAAKADGNLGNDTIRIYGNRFTVNGSTASCPLPAAGNWGFADLSDCGSSAVGTPTMADWIANGYSGSVSVGQCKSTQPGNAISSGQITSALDPLVTNGTVITLPIFDSYSGTGSSSYVNISAFTGFVITGYQSTGSANNRYIEGTLRRTTCTTECTTTSGTVGGGVARLRLIGSS